MLRLVTQTPLDVGLFEGVIGPFGSARFAAPAYYNAFRLDLPQPAAARLEVQPRAPAPVVAMVTKASHDTFAVRRRTATARSRRRSKSRAMKAELLAAGGAARPAFRLRGLRPLPHRRRSRRRRRQRSPPRLCSRASIRMARAQALASDAAHRQWPRVARQVQPARIDSLLFVRWPTPVPSRVEVFGRGRTTARCDEPRWARLRRAPTARRRSAMTWRRAFISSCSRRRRAPRASWT